VASVFFAIDSRPAPDSLVQKLARRMFIAAFITDDMARQCFFKTYQLPAV